MPITIIEERPDTVDATQLIEELESYLVPLYPAESRHGFSIEKLVREGVAFFVTRYDGAAAGCGGVKLYGTEYAEVKRMYVRPQFRGFGLGKRMLNHLASYTTRHAISVLRLETGIHQIEAIGMYERFGFERIPPFGDYFDDPVSICFEKHLNF